MRIAIPVANGKLSAHFGHCERFALVEVDRASGEVGEVEYAEPPPHAPGVLPQWLGANGVHLVIAGGMGRRAIDLFTQQGIEVMVGASSDEPGKIAQAYAGGSLTTEGNVCDH